jgi:predicted TIM-barrel fold metal-dependent hydrolase
LRNGISIIDVDRHVMEPMALWPEYLPAKYSALAPDVRPLSPPNESVQARLSRLGDHALLPTPPVVTVGGKPIWRGMTEIGYIEVGIHAEAHRDDILAAETARGQLATMDESGVDIAVLLPTYAGYLVYDDEIDADLSRAYAAAYSAWLADQCKQSPARLKGAVLLSRHDPAQMVRDLEIGLAAGHVAAVIRPNPVLGKTLAAPEMEPFFAACEANDVPILLHEGAHTRVQTAGASRFTTHFAQHACSHPMEMMMAFLALLEGGVLERHPGLRVAFLESGCGWLPYWLWRLDELEYAQMSEELRVLRRRLGIGVPRPEQHLLRPDEHQLPALSFDRRAGWGAAPCPTHTALDLRLGLGESGLDLRRAAPVFRYLSSSSHENRRRPRSRGGQEEIAVPLGKLLLAQRIESLTERGIRHQKELDCLLVEAPACPCC